MYLKENQIAISLFFWIIHKFTALNTGMVTVDWIDWYFCWFNFSRTNRRKTFVFCLLRKMFVWYFPSFILSSFFFLLVFRWSAFVVCLFRQRAFESLSLCLCARVFVLNLMYALCYSVESRAIRSSWAHPNTNIWFDIAAASSFEYELIKSKDMSGRALLVSVCACVCTLCKCVKLDIRILSMSICILANALT